MGFIRATVITFHCLVVSENNIYILQGEALAVPKRENTTLVVLLWPGCSPSMQDAFAT